MKCYIYDDTNEAPRVEDKTPICEEDFCHLCGDCLKCYGEDRCEYSTDGEHLWVKYREDKQ